LDASADFTRLVAGISDCHVEIMRGELAAIVHEATRPDVEYLFGDDIRHLAQDAHGVAVEFEHAAARRLDLVVGADGTGAGPVPPGRRSGAPPHDDDRVHRRRLPPTFPRLHDVEGAGKGLLLAFSPRGRPGRHGDEEHPT
jgi:hypothetical protein